MPIVRTAAVSVPLGRGIFGPHAEPGERRRPISSHVAIPFRLPSGPSRPDGTITCGIRGVAFTIASEQLVRTDPALLFDTFAICGRCGRGILASFEPIGGESPTRLLQAGRGHQLGSPTISPAAPSTGAPDRTPERAADYYRQGMENLPGNLDAASSMFRSAVQRWKPVLERSFSTSKAHCTSA